MELQSTTLVPAYHQIKHISIVREIHFAISDLGIKLWLYTITSYIFILFTGVIMYGL